MMDCVLCEEEIRPLQQRLCCQSCLECCHRTCTSMKQEAYRKLKKEDLLDKWTCQFCQDGLAGRHQNNNGIHSDHQDLENSIEISSLEGENERENTSRLSDKTIGNASTNSLNSFDVMPEDETIESSHNANYSSTLSVECSVPTNGFEENNNAIIRGSSENVENAGSAEITPSIGDEDDSVTIESSDADKSFESDIEAAESENVNADKVTSDSTERTVGTEKENSTNTVEKSGNEGTATQSSLNINGKVDALVMFNKDVLLSWTVTDDVTGPLCTKYIVSATDVGTGQNVYSFENPVHGFVSSRGCKIVSGLEPERMYRFNVTYWYDSEIVLHFRSERIYLENRQRSGLSTSSSTGSATNTISSTVASAGSAATSAETALASRSAITSVGSTVTSDGTRITLVGSIVSSAAPTVTSCSIYRTSAVSLTSSVGQSVNCSSASQVCSSQSRDSCRQHVVPSPQGQINSHRLDSTVSAKQVPIASTGQNGVSCGQLSTVSSRQPSDIPSKQNISFVVSSSRPMHTNSSGKGLTSSSVKPVRLESSLKDLKYSCCEVHGYNTNKMPKKTGTVDLEPSPFDKVLKDLLKLTPLEGINRFTNYHNRTYYFRLEGSERDLMYSLPREVADSPFQIQLRFCVNKIGLQPDNFPVGCVRVNGKWAQLQPVAVGCKIKSQGHPVDITSLCDIKATNSVMVSWNHQKDTNHCMTVQFVEKLKAEDLLKTLKETQYQHSQHTRDLIREKLKVDSDSDISTTSLRASLMCPIGHMRMSYPCIGKDCTHVQCVDAMTMLQMNEKKAKWTCLICSKRTTFDDLRINGYFMDIISSIGQDVNDVELLADGSWSNAEPAKQVVEDEAVDTLSESINMIDLTESDDENTPPSPVKQISNVFNKVSSIVKEVVSNSTVPLGENRSLLNSALNAADRVSNSSVIGTSIPSDRTYSGGSSNQNSVNNRHRNNHWRNHNQRPYNRPRNWSSNNNNSNWRNRYSSTDSNSSGRTYISYSSDNRSNYNSYCLNYNNYSSGSGRSNYSSFSQNSNYGQYQYRSWQNTY